LEETSFKEAKLEGCGFKNSKIKGTILDVNGFIDFGVSQGFKLE
jgi:hypothetical protein